MGIKGIYKEIGPGKRISLTKLAVDHLEQTGRPLRVAIDISIWQFQVQAAKGGSNPAIRTLFYRLLRLLSLHIQPIFVFDGPNKPVFKRNKRSGRGNGVATSMAKRMIRLFGFKAHDAPGEAEAECALLQLHGLVDAVLSEDVDTIMFGCTKTLRNWSAEGKGKTPTHISVYDTAELRQGESGLDREGMVLVALMSGGDYLPEGIPGAGVKLACEAARAKFGKSLCSLKRSDTVGLAEWRTSLKNELVTNESRFFRTKHKALIVPDDFPNLDVLRYYTHPVVSPPQVLERLKSQSWENPIDIVGLREFVRETFDWNYQGGAIKFIRVLAPCLLVKKIMHLSCQPSVDDVDIQQQREEKLVQSIKSRRAHFSTDATPELRISFTPTEIVGYSFEEEPEEDIEYGRDGLALNSDDEFDVADEEGAAIKSGPKKPFNPNEPDLSWIPETFMKLGLPVTVEDWEETQRAKAVKKTRTKATTSRVPAKTGGMQAGALDRFVRVRKNVSATEKDSVASQLDRMNRSRSPLELLTSPPQKQRPSHTSSDLPEKPSRLPSLPSKQPSKQAKSRNRDKGAQPDSSVNPWSIASLHSPSRPKPLATVATAKSADPILIASSPPASPAKNTRTRVEQPSSPPRSELRSHSSDTKSPAKRRSGTPVDSRPGSPSPPSRSRSPSPNPRAARTSRRKLARTESMPTQSPRGEKNHDVFGTQRNTRAVARAQTVIQSRSGGSDEDDEDEDLDLPPLSAFPGRIPKCPSTTTVVSTTTHHSDDASPILQDASVTIIIDSSPVPVAKTRPFRLPDLLPEKGILDHHHNLPEPTQRIAAPLNKTTAVPPTAAGGRKDAKKQSKLSDVFGMRTTKIYAPRKSQPGFFEEIEVTVAEVESQQARCGRNKGRSWRRSDISVVDLTSDD